jgi:uncharacterized membrane protein (UPF0127 family)
LDLLATPGGRLWLGRAIWALLIVGVVASIVVGASRPPRPRLVSPAALAATTAHSRPSLVAGLNQVGFRIVGAHTGPLGRAGCALLADTAARRAQGLRGRRDLAGYDAMIVPFPAQTLVSLDNSGVKMSLSVASFDAVGVYIGQTDLPLCVFTCPPVYSPPDARFAVETPAGGLQRLGIAAGSALLIGGTCA